MSKREKLIRKNLFKLGLKQITSWAVNKDYHVEFCYSVQDEFRPSDSMITINKRQGLEKQLYSLLHECGHLLLQQSEDAYAEKYPASAKMAGYNRNSRLQRSAKYKVDVISEEIDAWRRGKALANRLGVYVDEEAYHSLMALCVHSYMMSLTR